MGVEYQHWLLPADPDFRPAADLARRLHGVLEQFGLAGEHQIHDLTAGAERRVKGSLPGAELPATTLVRYDELVDGPVVAGLIGSDEDEPYVQKRLVLVGAEQHVLAGHEEIHVDVGPPAVATRGYRSGLWTSHWAPEGARLAPKLHATVPVPKGLSGVFRAAVVLDFGKSVPPFVLAAELGMPDVGRALEDREFVDALAAAFGTPVIETGFLY